VFGVILLAAAVSGCASAPGYEEAFSANHQVQGSVDTVPASMDTTWGSALEVLSQQGFLVQQADAKSHIVLANREMRETDNKDYSYTVTATVTFVPLAEQATRVMVAANQTTELHRKEYRWWKLFWLIPLIPTGSDYTTVVVDRDTVRAPRFYQDFFGALKQSCEAKNQLASATTRDNGKATRAPLP
jgi:hypothetical protein